MSGDCDFGLIGLAVMGENLALNVESRGYKVAVYNRTTSKVDALIEGRAKGKNFVGTHTIEEFVKSVKRPRKLMMLVKAGPAVDSLIEQLLPHCEPGDIIIDGGNEQYENTERRTKQVEAAGLLYVGCGVSGGEEGALKGPSLMPGGSPDAWPHMKEMFQAIAAKVGPNNDIPCCEWLGSGGAGNYVKMVHNGIEYGDMQLICEAYQLLRELGGLSNDEMYDVLDEWNKGELESYLIEITRVTSSALKTTRAATTTWSTRSWTLPVPRARGKWMSQLALDLGVPSTLVTTAVFARGLSAQKGSSDASQQATERSIRISQPRNASGLPMKLVGDKQGVRRSRSPSVVRIQDRQLRARISCNCRPHRPSTSWKLNYGDCALLWRGGCIIRARFLDRIKEAFDADPKLENLLLTPFFEAAVENAQESWRAVVAAASILGIPVPAFSTALCYYDGYRLERLPANLLASPA